MKSKRWLERVKTVLICLLTLSALYLLTLTPLVRESGLLDLFPSQGTTASGGTAVTLTAAAQPSRMAVGSGTGRYGLQYDQEQVDSLFARMGPLLGEALSSAGQPESISEEDWQRYLSGVCIYFDFSGSVPLSALGGWLHAGEPADLTASARRVLLAAGEGTAVLLCYEDAGDGSFWACDTVLTQALHLAPAVEGIEDNGARFAFESEELSGLLQPYTMITEESGGAVYAVTSSLSGEDAVADVLEALSFNGQNHASVSGGEAYLDGDNRLEVGLDGTVSYRAAQEGKYPVAFSGERATVAEVIETVRELAELTIGARCGDARLYLADLRETEDGYVVRFGYQLNGCAVWLYEEGWAAEFRVRDDWVTEFTLCFRSYTATGARALLPSMERAAVMLPDLTEERRELVMQYRDRGNGELSPMWVAE